VCVHVKKLFVIKGPQILVRGGKYFECLFVFNIEVYMFIVGAGVAQSVQCLTADWMTGV
jgi:hypothetical protein